MHDILLDQNHWIYLARARSGNPLRPSHRYALDALSEAVDSCAVRLPIDCLHLIELLRSESANRRLNLAEVLDRFSRGWFLAGWPQVISCEINRAVALVLGATNVPPPPEVVGRGFLFALPPESALTRQFSPQLINIASALAAMPGAIEDLVANVPEANRNRQNATISARNESDAEHLNRRRPELRRESPDVLRRAKLASYNLDHQAQIQLALAAHGMSLAEFMNRGLEFLTEFWEHIPSLRVDRELTLYRDRQWSRPVSTNDFADIGHLALGIPYMSVVVTERFWARATEEALLAETYGTKVCQDISELPSLIDRLSETA